MKVILISDALDEPFELESPPHGDEYTCTVWPMKVREQVEAVLRTERMKADAEHHGIFGR